MQGEAMDTLSLDAWFSIVVIAVILTVSLVATFLNIKNTKGPKEHRFVMRTCVLTWVLMIIFLVSVACLPSPYRYIVIVIYIILFPVMIYRMATLHQLIRVVDQRDRDEDD